MTDGSMEEVYNQVRDTVFLYHLIHNYQGLCLPSLEEGIDECCIGKDSGCIDRFVKKENRNLHGFAVIASPNLKGLESLAADPTYGLSPFTDLGDSGDMLAYLKEMSDIDGGYLIDITNPQRWSIAWCKPFINSLKGKRHPVDLVPADFGSYEEEWSKQRLSIDAIGTNSYASMIAPQIIGGISVILRESSYGGTRTGRLVTVNPNLMTGDMFFHRDDNEGPYFDPENNMTIVQRENYRNPEGDVVNLDERRITPADLNIYNPIRKAA